MTIKSNYLYFILVMLCMSCKHETHLSIIKVSLLERKPYEISNGKIEISKTTELKVPDSFALSRFDKWLWANNEIIVADFSLTKAIYCFSSEGFFKYYIPFGSGEEFSDFCVGEDSLLIVSDARNGRVIKYNRKTGQMINVIDFQNGTLLSNIFYNGQGKYVIFNNYGTGNWGNYKLFQISTSETKNKVINKWVAFEETQNKAVHMRQYNTFSSNPDSNRIDFHEFGSNTIFELTGNSISSVARFVLFPQKENFDIDTSSYHDFYESISEKSIAVPEDYVVITKSYVYFQYLLNDSSYQVLYDNSLQKAIFNSAFIVDTAFKTELPEKWLSTGNANEWLSLGWQQKGKVLKLFLYSFKIE